MTDPILETIADGSTLYVRPVGFVSAAWADNTSTFDYQSSGLRFAGFVLYNRTPDGAVGQRYMTGEGFRAARSSLPTHAVDQIDGQLARLAAPLKSLVLKDERTIPFTRPLVMGVLNVTPDSFSDGGDFLDSGKAVRHARAMVAAGADIIDIGGESTRPGATPVWEGEEAERIAPVIEALAGENVTMSVDTRHAFVMEKALAAGAHIVNDVSALSHDPDGVATVAAAGVPVVLMHAQGDPRTMQDDPHYEHVLLDVYDYLAERIAVCEAAGIRRDKIIIDPGIGFGKRVVQDNLALINGLMLFQSLGCPVLLGASRKRFIGAITGVDAADQRLSGSLAAAVQGAQNGANILRVHDVAQTAEALRLVQAFSDASVMDGVV